MSRTYIQPGHVLDVTASGSDIAAGDVVVRGARVAVALDNIADGDTGSASVEGVHELPKVSGSAISQGATVYWNGSAMTTASSGNTEAGYAFEAAQSADTSMAVKLRG